MFAGSLSTRSLWTPKNIDTVIWFDAAETSTITTVGSDITQWLDKSGNNRHVAPTTPANRPVYTTNGLNGLPILTFGGTRFLTNTLFPTNLTSINLFVVARWAVKTWTGDYNNDLQVLIDNDHNGALSRGFVMQDRPDLPNSPVTFAHLPYVSAGARDTEITGNNNWKIINGLAVSGGNDSLRINGVHINTQINGGVFNLRPQFNIGRWSTFARYYQGLMAEIVLTSNSNNTNKIEGYLAHKWGLESSLPIGHPYKNYPPRGL